MHFAYRVRLNDSQFDHICSYHTQVRLHDGGLRRVFPRFHFEGGQMTLDFVATREVGQRAWACVLRISNHTGQAVRLRQAQLGMAVSCKALTLSYFSSDWGSEYSPFSQPIDGEFGLRCVSGRSAKGFVPYASLRDDRGRSFAMALGWSGNWELSAYEKGGAAGQWADRLCLMGLSDNDGFYHDIQPGEVFETPPVYLSTGPDRESADGHLRRHFQAALSPQAELQWERPPAVYNSWWPFEDRYIDEATFLSNAREAKALGLDYAVLDAGWFGPEEAGQGWYDKRGDWDLVNTARFPGSLKRLCDAVKALGLKPGIWCEIEAVGRLARLNSSHPELIASREGQPIHYVCFGSQAGRDWAMSVMDRLIGGYGAQWVKIDFNLDPGAGCDRLDHGHGAGDGLWAHYQGYYAFLRALRRKYPGVVIENCASGGLRTDIGMLAHTHLGFLSDPDHTTFHLQCVWGALSFLHQASLYHFAWSQTLQGHNLGIKDPISEGGSPAKLDYMARAVMLGVPGFSYDLTRLPAWAAERLTAAADFYREIGRDFVMLGSARRLTGQPLASGQGERYPAFSLQSPAGEQLVFAFRLPGAPEATLIHPAGLNAEGRYALRYLDAGTQFEASGQALMSEGLPFSGLPEEASEIVRITPIVSEHRLQCHQQRDRDNLNSFSPGAS